MPSLEPATPSGIRGILRLLTFPCRRRRRSACRKRRPCRRCGRSILSSGSRLVSSQRPPRAHTDGEVRTVGVTVVVTAVPAMYVGHRSPPTAGQRQQGRDEVYDGQQNVGNLPVRIVVAVAVRGAAAIVARAVVIPWRGTRRQRHTSIGQRHAILYVTPPSLRSRTRPRDGAANGSCQKPRGIPRSFVPLDL